MEPSEETKSLHHGRNLKRFREMFGLKQQALAIEIGESWSQKRISLLEGREMIEDELLEKIARVLKVPVNAIKLFDEEAAICFLTTMYDNSSMDPVLIAKAAENSFVPMSKFLEVIEENKALYERLLISEKEKVEFLKQNSTNFMEDLIYYNGLPHIPGPYRLTG